MDWGWSQDEVRVVMITVLGRVELSCDRMVMVLGTVV